MGCASAEKCDRLHVHGCSNVWACGRLCKRCKAVYICVVLFVHECVCFSLRPRRSAMRWSHHALRTLSPYCVQELQSPSYRNDLFSYRYRLVLQMDETMNNPRQTFNFRAVWLAGSRRNPSSEIAREKSARYTKSRPNRSLGNLFLGRVCLCAQNRRPWRTI